MKKGLSAQTKVLIGLVAALAAFFAYYFLVYQTFNKLEASFNAAISELHTQIDAEQVKIDSINVRKAAIEEGKKLNSAVEPFDNNSTESAVLSGFLKNHTLTFSISFGNASSDDVYARRPVTVNFTAANLREARAAIDSIADCRFRNIITDMKLNALQADGGLSGPGTVTCSFTVTFLESVKK